MSIPRRRQDWNPRGEYEFPDPKQLRKEQLVEFAEAIQEWMYYDAEDNVIDPIQSIPGGEFVDFMTDLLKQFSLAPQRGSKG